MGSWAADAEIARQTLLVKPVKVIWLVRRVVPVTVLFTEESPSEADEPI